MKGYLTSYVGLFEDRPGVPPIAQITIPLIQRDYAQGRAQTSAEEIRHDFLEVLLDAVAGGEPVSLDFIYGKVSDGVFQPLDGQQRLTTLFLIHWYFASLAGSLDPRDAWTRFSYETRPSARFFCESLVQHPLPEDQEEPAAWIQDQPWYLYTWRNDPTITSMLTMIDAIRSEARLRELDRNADTAWKRLTDLTSPAVSFYLLPLEGMQSEEELYIKMNSRGKPLTEFENFKAIFERDIRHSPRADDFAHRIDGPWSDLMWPIRGDDDIVDDEFVRYIDYLTEVRELCEGDIVFGRLGPRARAIFGADNPGADEHLQFLFEAFDAWGGRAHEHEVFRVFSTAVPGEESYDPAQVTLFGANTVNLFEACCRHFDSQPDGNRPFTLQQSLLLYAVLIHLVHDTEDFPRRARFLRNLLSASEDEVRRPNMPGLLQDVESLIRDEALDGLSTFSSHQVYEEQLKREFLRAHPELTECVFRLEDHPLLRGSLGAFELSAETLPGRAVAFEAAFADPNDWLDLTGALLATGDYQRQRPQSEAWQFGTAHPTGSVTWRYLFTDASREDLAQTRTVLGHLLDELAQRPTEDDLRTGMAEIMTRWLADRESEHNFDWRYYLVKYPAMRGALNDHREGRTGIYYGVEGELGYSLCMLRTYQLNGKYRDPILLQVWLDSGVGDAVQDLWFTGPVSRPRWLRLERSSTGIRSVAEGFELQAPEDGDEFDRFRRVCEQRRDVVSADGRLLLEIPQEEHGGPRVDSADRVQVGAAFVADLVDADL